MRRQKGFLGAVNIRMARWEPYRRHAVKPEAKTPFVPGRITRCDVSIVLPFSLVEPHP